MKVALVYDRVNKWGGAERVLLSLHKIFPKAPLYTSVYDKKRAPWATVFTVNTSFLQYIPFAKSHHQFFSLLMPFAFASFSFDKYDVVISVTSEFAKGIITKGKTKHLCICLTPTRYLWSGYAQYFPNTLFRLIAFPLVVLLRQIDIYLAKKPDMFVAISETVKKRIKKFYKKDSIVIYPPLSKLPNGVRNNLLATHYFLTVARLSKFTSYKRVDIAVKAATKVGASLIVVGDGNTEEYKKIAGPTVQFVGKVSDEELACYYKNCRALIFPGEEDFGLAMVEALSFGKPVIAYKAGGATEIIQNKRAGTFFAHQTETSLAKVLKSFRDSTYNTDACKKAARRFSEHAFTTSIRKLLSKSNI